MNTQEREFARFLKLLDDHGALSSVLLVGSWAEFLYGRAGVLEGFTPSIRTLDMDFLVRNLRRPQPPINLASAAREAGYLVSRDRLSGVTKIYDREGLEIEFLIGKRGAGLEQSLETNLGVTAQSLWHMDILARNAICVEYFGMAVNIPTPEAYAAQKMVVNHERGAKGEKDMEAIRRLWPFLNPEALEEAVGSLSKKERARFKDCAERNGVARYAC